MATLLTAVIIKGGRTLTGLPAALNPYSDVSVVVVEVVAGVVSLDPTLVADASTVLFVPLVVAASAAGTGSSGAAAGGSYEQVP